MKCPRVSPFSSLVCGGLVIPVEESGLVWNQCRICGHRFDIYDRTLEAYLSDAGKIKPSTGERVMKGAKKDLNRAPEIKGGPGRPGRSDRDPKLCSFYAMNNGKRYYCDSDHAPGSRYCDHHLAKTRAAYKYKKMSSGGIRPAADSVIDNDGGQNRPTQVVNAVAPPQQANEYKLKSTPECVRETVRLMEKRISGMESDIRSAEEEVQVMQADLVIMRHILENLPKVFSG